MKKEVFLAIGIGFALGLVITFGIWTANKSLRSAGQILPKPTPTPEVVVPATATPSPAATLQLTLTAPEDEAVVNTSKITLTGKSAANVSIAILYEGGETFTQTNAAGEFAAEIPLVGGYNVIKATAMDAAGNSAEATLTVTYTTAKI